MAEFWSSLVGKVLILVIAVVIAYIVQRVLVPVLKRVLEAAEIPNASIFVNVLRVVIWSVAILCVLEPVFGIDPTGVVTALGVASVALSLGLQDTISNVISGFALMLGKVIKPGDEVEIDGFTGRVKDVTWRSTTVITRGGTEEVIPNSVLNTSALTLRTAWEAGCVTVPFVVSFDADLAAVTADLSAMTDRVLGDMRDPDLPTEVRFTEMSVTGIKGEIYGHVKSDVIPVIAADLVIRELQGYPSLVSFSGMTNASTSTAVSLPANSTVESATAVNTTSATAASAEQSAAAGSAPLAEAEASEA